VPEHQCCRAVQPYQKGQDATHVLQQWHWNVCQALLAVLHVHEASPGQYHRPCDCLVRLSLSPKCGSIEMSNFRNFEKVIIGAYRWLSDLYQDGDRIFLFGTNSLGSGATYSQTFLLGFSRGAYQVRALAAMIKMVSPVCHLFFARLDPQILFGQVGLIHPGNQEQIPL
jgi:hypothetical protein